MLNKHQIHIINATAKTDWTKAQAMLDGVNLALGTEYGWLNKRVVTFENPKASTAEKYAHAHDAWTWAPNA